MGLEPKFKAMAERTTILRADIGSRGFGLNHAESDHDEKGVCIEDFEAHVRLEGKFEQHVEQDKSSPNKADHLDLEIFSLEKFLRLAIHGNPTILALLFSKNLIKSDARGIHLQELVPYLISRHWGKRFLGYMESQRQKLKGERGQMRVTRQDLIEKHGYDTKYAMHLLRLGLQGVEVMETGKMTLPMNENERGMLLRVREGLVSFNEVMQLAGDLERHLKDLIDNSSLPEAPDKAYVDNWMRNMYWQTWKSRETFTNYTSDGGLK